MQSVKALLSSSILLRTKMAITKFIWTLEKKNQISIPKEFLEEVAVNAKQFQPQTSGELKHIAKLNSEPTVYMISPLNLKIK